MGAEWAAMINIIPIASAKSWSVREASHQSAFIGSCLLVACVSPVYQVVDQFSPCVLWPLVIGLTAAPPTFFQMVGIVFLLWGVDAILRDGCGIYEQNYVASLQGSEMSAGYHYRGLMLGI